MDRLTALTAAVVVAAAAACGAFERDPGGAADAPQSWGLGARGDALGRAYGPLADDAAATFWNAAGLAGMTRDEVSFAYGRPFKEIGGLGVGDAAVAKPLLYLNNDGKVASMGTIGAAAAFRRASGIVEADEDAGATGREFANTDADFYVAYALGVGKNGALGFTLKNVTRTVANYDDSGFGVDLGARARPAAGLSVSLVLRNLIAPSYELVALRDIAPLTAEVGAAYRAFGVAALTAVGSLTRETYYDAGAGVEVAPVRFIALRGGYGMGDGRPRVGLGLAFENFRFDYALRFGGDLGDTHLAAVSFLVGGPPEPPVEDGGDEGYIEYDEEGDGGSSEGEGGGGTTPGAIPGLEPAPKDEAPPGPPEP